MDVRLVTLESDFNALAVPSPQKLGSLGLASALDCERRTVSITDAHRYGEALRCSRSPRWFRRAAVRSRCHEGRHENLEIAVLLWQRVRESNPCTSLERAVS